MKIVIVDDHPLVRKGLAAVISMQPNVQLRERPRINRKHLW